MTSSFKEKIAEAQENVRTVSPQQAQQALNDDANTLVIDVRDRHDIEKTGKIPGAAEISLGTLFYKADHSMPDEVRDANLDDKDRPILCACAKGAQATLAAKVLKDYGYKNVKVIEGGTLAWKEANLPTEDA